MKGLATQRYDAGSEYETSDPADTATLPAMILPDAQATNDSAANAASSDELLQRMDRLIRLGERIEETLARIAKSLERSPPTRSRRAARSRTGSTRRKPAKS